MKLHSALCLAVWLAQCCNAEPIPEPPGPYNVGVRRLVIDFDNPDDAANCAGVPSASVGLYGVLLAGLGLGAVAVAARRGRLDQSGAPPDQGPVTA